MYIKGLFEVFKVLGRIGIKPKDVIGMGGDIVKMGKSLFNTRINPKLLTFIEKNQKIPTKILENIKLHARTLKNATESQKNLFLENIKSIQKAKTPKMPPKPSSPVTGVQRPAASVKELPEWTKGWKPTVIKGGKDGLATGGIANHFRIRKSAGGIGDRERVGFEKNPLKNFDRKTRSPDKGVTKIKKPITVGAEGNVKKLLYLDKATGKKITVYKAVVMDSPKKINYKMKAGIGGYYKSHNLGEFSTLKEAEDAVTNYRKDNPKKIPPRDPKKVYITKDKRIAAIKAGEGVVDYKTAKQGLGIEKGHATNIWNPDAKIKPKDIIYTPREINQAMAGNTSASKAVDLDYKIDVAENKIKEIKKSNLPKAEKIKEIVKQDNKLMKYVAQSDGYKTVVLSGGNTYGEIFQKLSSMDMLDEFSDMTEKQTKKFVNKYFTLDGKLKSEWTKGKISNIDKEGIKKSYVFLENVKNAQNNAIKKTQYLQMLKEKSKKSGLFGKFAKGAAKLGLRTVGAAIPFIGPAMVGWGTYDVLKAQEMGLTNEELAVAYGAGPEIAQMWSDLKPQMKENIQGMTLEGNISEGDTRGYDKLSGVDQYIINRGI